MTRHVYEVCPCCGRNTDGAYWVFPSHWTRRVLYLNAEAEVRETVDWLLERRRSEKTEAPPIDGAPRSVL